MDVYKLKRTPLARLYQIAVLKPVQMPRSSYGAWAGDPRVTALTQYLAGSTTIGNFAETNGKKDFTPLMQFHFLNPKSVNFHHDGGTAEQSWFTHMLMCIGCKDPKQGTIFKDVLGQTFNSKPWTVYLCSIHMLHAGPPGYSNHNRCLSRFYLQLPWLKEFERRNI